MTKARAMKILGGAIVLALLGWAMVGAAVRPVTFESNPPGIMNTQTHLTVAARQIDSGAAREALERAEHELRDLETRMSVTISLSELSRLNHARPGELVKLSGRTLEVLRAARELTERTAGTFDPTCGPLFDLWKLAGQRKRAPAQGEVDKALAACGWRHFVLEGGGARRLHEGAGIGLGGIAKGYAVDRAIEAMRGPKLLRGMVNLAGHIRFFGQPERGGPWRIDVQDPFDPQGRLCTVGLTEGGICTSGNYERYIEIAGRRYHHIVDPRTGWPATLAASVTVTAATTMACEGWTKCLSVLGARGLPLVGGKTGVEALVIAGGPADWTWYATPGFEKLLIAPLPAERRGAWPPATRPTTEPGP